MAYPIPSFEQIVQRGFFKIRLKRSGMYQIIPFKVTFETLPIGRVPFLTTEKIVDMPELVRVCEEYKFPILAKNGKIFPSGKGAADFVIKEKQSAAPVPLPAPSHVQPASTATPSTGASQPVQ